MRSDRSLQRSAALLAITFAGSACLALEPFGPPLPVEAMRPAAGATAGSDPASMASVAKGSDPTPAKSEQPETPSAADPGASGVQATEASEESARTADARSSPKVSAGANAVERRALGAARPRAGTASTDSTPQRSMWERATDGMVGPLVVVLSLIATLAGVVRVLGRQRARRGGSLGASLGVGGRAPSGVLEVLGRYPLGAGLTLVLLKVDRRVLLLTQQRHGRLGGTTMSTLSEISDPDEVASILLKCRESDASSMAHKFQSIFRSLDREAAEKVEQASARATRPLRQPSTVAPSMVAPRVLPASVTAAAVSAPTPQLTSADAARSIRRRLEALRAGSVS